MLLKLISIIEQVGREWNLRHPYGPRISIGDISQQRGGAFPGHDAHRKGIDADIRYVITNSEGQLDFCSYDACDSHRPGNYDEDSTRELINLFLKYGVSSVLVDPLSNISGSKITQDGSYCGTWIPLEHKCSGDRRHSNHFHIQVP